MAQVDFYLHLPLLISKLAVPLPFLPVLVYDLFYVSVMSSLCDSRARVEGSEVTVLSMLLGVTVLSVLLGVTVLSVLLGVTVLSVLTVPLAVGVSLLLLP